MSNVGWKAVTNSNKRKMGSDDFLRVKPDCKLKVRLLGKPVKIVKIFTNERQCIILDDEETGEKLKEKYPDKLSNISIRYASWCINREDNSLKILDIPASVARKFGTRAAQIDRKINGITEGCDWGIMTNGKKGKDVRYEAVYIDETPLSEIEKELVEDKKAGDDHFDLTKIFRDCSFEEAEERLLAGR